MNQKNVVSELENYFEEIRNHEEFPLDKEETLLTSEIGSMEFILNPENEKPAVIYVDGSKDTTKMSFNHREDEFSIEIGDGKYATNIANMAIDQILNELGYDDTYSSII